LTKTPHIFERVTSSEQDTGQFGRFFSQYLQPGDIVALFGDVGSGKTVFVKSVCEELKAEEPVNSPTFIILNEYTGRLRGQKIQIHHFDFYRVEKSKDIDELGIQDYIGAPDSVTLIEWAEHIERFLMKTYWKINFQKNGENERKIRIEFLQ
jgi:tRNA threonylcarbamoyladenosine biosynthesis protein TsaE